MSGEVSYFAWTDLIWAAQLTGAEMASTYWLNKHDLVNNCFSKSCVYCGFFKFNFNDRLFQSNNRLKFVSNIFDVDWAFEMLLNVISAEVKVLLNRKIIAEI